MASVGEGMRSYSIEQLGRLLDVPPDRVKGLVRAAFPDAGQTLRFSFQDLVLLRAAKGLADGQIAVRKIRMSLERLRKQLPEGAPLSGVTLHAEKDRIVVDDGRVRWQPDSGQALFDFEVAELEERVSALNRETPEEPVSAPEEGSDRYELGCALEESDPDGAIAAYREALRLEPTHADAHLNLGRLLHERGELAEGERHYRLALASQPMNPTAFYNLGTLLEDLGRIDEAIFSYQQALAQDPQLGDAHYNLARLYEQAGRAADAVRHLKHYRTLANG